MDKKAKKRVEVLRKKIEKLNLQLAGAKQQEDEPGEVAALEAEIAKFKQEMTQLKAS